jgi:hypothetical protein
MMRRWRLACAFGLALLGCEQTVEPATQIVVRIDSDLQPAVQLTKVELQIGKADGFEESTSFKREVALLASDAVDDGRGRKSLPLSLSITPGHEQRVMTRVVAHGVYGSDKAERRLLEQSAIVTFQPRKTLLLDLFLGAVCVDRDCHASDSEVCYPSAHAGVIAGACGGLEAFSGSRVRVAEPDELGSLTEPRDDRVRDAGVARDGEAAQEDASTPLDLDAGADVPAPAASEDAASGSAPDAGLDAEAPITDAGMNVRDAEVAGDGSLSPRVDAAAPLRDASAPPLEPDAGPPVCNAQTPHGCYTLSPASPMGCPARVPEYEDGYPALDQWDSCNGFAVSAGVVCEWVGPNDVRSSCLCDSGVHWICIYQ